MNEVFIKQCTVILQKREIITLDAASPFVFKSLTIRLQRYLQVVLSTFQTLPLQNFAFFELHNIYLVGYSSSSQLCTDASLM